MYLLVIVDFLFKLSTRCAKTAQVLDTVMIDLSWKYDQSDVNHVVNDEKYQVHSLELIRQNVKTESIQWPLVDWVNVIVLILEWMTRQDGVICQ